MSGNWFQRIKARAGAGLITLAWFALGASAAQAQRKPVLFQHVRVFDGEQFIVNTNVLIKDGTIREIGPDVADADARVIEGAGKTLLPGLIDAHTHIHSEEALRQALRFGVTTELDMGTPPRFMQMMKSRENDGIAAFWSAGQMATAPGGHGTEYGGAPPTLTRAKDADGWVEDRVREGSDYIKIIYGDGALVHPRFARPMLGRETMAALVDAAHKRHKMAVVHIESLQQAKDAIEAGADGLAHMYYGTPKDANFGRLMAEHHAFVTATLTVHHSVCGDSPGAKLLHDPDLGPMLPRDAASDLKREFPMGMDRHDLCKHFGESLGQLRAAGVPILAGTDAPNPGTTQGASLHQELEYLVAAGLTTREALVAATSGPAKAFHIPDRGRIAPGLRADLLLVEGDPEENILATRKILGVWKHGEEDEAARRKE